MHHWTVEHWLKNIGEPGIRCRTDLCHWDEAAQTWMLEPGTITLKVGGSSDNLPLSAEVVIWCQSPRLITPFVTNWCRDRDDCRTIPRFKERAENNEIKVRIQHLVSAHLQCSQWRLQCGCAYCVELAEIIIRVSLFHEVDEWGEEYLDNYVLVRIV